MSVPFQRWPDELAAHYRARGYWLDQPLTRILDAQVLRRPEAAAILCGERVFTYGDVDRLSSNLAARLAARGLGAGDTALVQLPNVAEFYVVFFALLKAGIAPLNALFSHRRLEMTAYAEQIRPKLLIGARQNPLFADDLCVVMLKAASPGLETVLFLGGEDAPTSLEAWTGEPAGEDLSFRPTAADEVAFFQLSGGSTGTPKLIPRTHNDYDYSVRASAEICGLGETTRFLCALPAPHNFPMSSPGALGVFHAGGSVVMAPNPDPAICFDLIERYGVDMAALVPSAVTLWLQAAKADAGKLKSLKLVQVGGANFSESHARQVPDAFGCRLQQVFGMAEGLVNYTRLDDADERVFTTQGRPISEDDEIKILSEDGSPVPDGSPGRLATRGPYTVRGYFEAPEHNATVFDADGFYCSGDLVIRDAAGYLKVVGRVKDQINRGGEKIATEEIENLIQRHPGVRLAALVAIDDPLLGEKSCAFVVASDPELKPLTLRRHLAALGVADYKLPDRFRFVDALPLTPIGKTDKKALRAALAEPA